MGVVVSAPDLERYVPSMGDESDLVDEVVACLRDQFHGKTSIIRSRQEGKVEVDFSGIVIYSSQLVYGLQDAFGSTDRVVALEFSSVSDELWERIRDASKSKR